MSGSAFDSQADPVSTAGLVVDFMKRWAEKHLHGTFAIPLYDSSPVLKGFGLQHAGFLSTVRADLSEAGPGDPWAVQIVTCLGMEIPDSASLGNWTNHMNSSYPVGRHYFRILQRSGRAAVFHEDHLHSSLLETARGDVADVPWPHVFAVLGAVANGSPGAHEAVRSLGGRPPEPTGDDLAVLLIGTEG